jgi:diguanylate cyclase (GGDEF)-like protein/PAS domain S-box-containing protein
MPTHSIATSNLASPEDESTALLDRIGEALVHVDDQWVVRACNEVYLRLVGLPREQVVGRTPQDFAPGFVRSIFFEAIENCRQTRSPMMQIGFSTVLRRWLIVRVFPVEGGMVMLANHATAADVTQHLRAQRAVHDALTGLGNKLALEEHVESLVQQARPFTLTLLGIDRFREVTDDHGHGFADMVVLELASQLKASTSGESVCFRVSQEEFAVVTTDDAAAEIRAGLYIAALQAPLVLDGKALELVASAGTAAHPGDGDAFEPLLRRAGLALRQARSHEAPAPVAYRPDLEAASLRRAEIEAELRACLDAPPFVLHLQPKVSLLGGALTGAEALLRWAHPARGLLAPGVFLGIAEEKRLMGAIDAWVLAESLKIGATLRAQGLAVPMSINLSVQSLSDPAIVERVRAALASAGLPAGLLEVEIPEGTVMRDVRRSAEVLVELQAMGVRISVDDFGTGYSSFAYLAKFPVHALKIDRSFVRDIVDGETSRKIVRGIVRLAHSLSMEVVAEGAETDLQIRMLRRYKCDAVQGFGIARPMPLADFIAFARERQAAGVPDAATI